MNKKTITKKSKKAKRIFAPHKKIYVRVKENAKNPFGSSVFAKFIEMKKMRETYTLYIHLRDNYMCFSHADIDKIKIPIDEKLWVEIISVFEIISAGEAT